jgi:hypothetical protein
MGSRRDPSGNDRGKKFLLGADCPQSVDHLTREDVAKSKTWPRQLARSLGDQFIRELINWRSRGNTAHHNIAPEPLIRVVTTAQDEEDTRPTSEEVSQLRQSLHGIVPNRTLPTPLSHQWRNLSYLQEPMLDMLE